METILCATDFSSWSENAVKYAHELAQLMKARLILFHMQPTNAQPVAVLAGGQDFCESARLEEEDELSNRKLQELKNKLEKENTGSAVLIHTIKLVNPARYTFPDLLQQENVGLVVIGYDRTSTDKGTFSALCEIQEVMKTSSCPVLVVPQKAVFKPLWKIVYATDLKREPSADCAFLLKLARLFSAEIMLLHVLTNDVVGARELANEELQKVYRRLPYRNISFYIEANESIENGISEFVSGNKADMLVISSHPKHVWQNLLKHNCSKKDCFQASLPMLIRHQSAKACL